MKTMYNMVINVKGDERRARGVEKLIMDKDYELYNYSFRKPFYYGNDTYRICFKCDLQTKNDIAEFLELKNKYRRKAWEF